MEQHHILSFWRDVEVFNLPPIKDNYFIPLRIAALPWQKPALAAPGKTWKFTVWFGKIQHEQIVQTIENILNNPASEKADWITPATGLTCLAALVLDENGRPDEKSYVQPTFVQGLKCLLHQTPVSSVSQLMQHVQADYETRYLIPPEEQLNGRRCGDPLNATQLQQELEYHQQLTAAWLHTPIEMYCTVQEVPADNTPDTSFLNSFYLDDLQTLINTPVPQWSKPLQEYMTVHINKDERTDLLASEDALIQTLDPALLPAGRWPSDITHGLYTAQRGAVNTLLHELETTGGMQGINGPPGTGKTTLLLDIIAHVIVARAERILQTGTDNFFISKYNKIQRDQKKFAGYYQTNPDIFADSSIVVASNNNGAVENISREIPATRKIDTRHFASANYFAEAAQRLLQEESWGIMSATLGSYTNRIDFNNKFWRTDKTKNSPGFHDLLHAIYKDPDNDQSPSCHTLLQETASELSTLLEQFRQFKQDASAVFSQLPAIRIALQQYDDYEKELSQLQDSILSKEDRGQELRRTIRTLNDSIPQIQQSLTLHSQYKPRWHWFHKLFNTPLYRKWYSFAACLLQELKQINNNKTVAKLELDHIEEVLTLQYERHNEVVKREEEIEAQVTAYDKLRATLHATYGLPLENIVDTGFYAQSLQQKHLRCPWSSPAVNKLRSNILLKSLQLHQYAIMANARQFRANLDLFFEMLTGKAIVKDSIVRELWNTFFFSVPVASTTLASAGRLFAALGKDAIGWLLIDEAGQATPQSAAGIIARSRRCIAVGDPMQVEPVVTIPSSLVRILAAENQTAPQWSPLTTSVQLLADRITTKGAWIQPEDQEEKIWTGFPLRTHRRCNDPMFSISNTIAYGGQMVKAVKDKEDSFATGPSTWFHVNGGNVHHKQVVEEELLLLDEKIRELELSGYTEPIFVITPFKAIETACRHVFAKRKQVACGTIHTFQGKETDIVFLVLGSDPAKAGSRKWASAQPNMLNVAVTRARKRLYVIGNKILWEQHPYFNIMAQQLYTGAGRLKSSDLL
ncbi:MAG TPA: AAA domain-containing protein [Chitinophaga sp.]|uniref:DEAD/DEAH box helicase n=1 Tax=Chitinophaga sp. TaxID=1869181 RepID=UPI002BB7292B|nr:AAA domain-containing protein [Chitinophaga sp.]HVI47747.1 AAA domain-containing protein [Chitinophaga sp.]